MLEEETPWREEALRWDVLPLGAQNLGARGGEAPKGREGAGGVGGVRRVRGGRASDADQACGERRRSACGTPCMWQA